MNTTPVLGATLTSMKVGGPVSRYVQPASFEELTATVKEAREAGLPLRVLGGGSNILLPDGEFAGVLIRPGFKQLRLIEEGEAVEYAGLLSEWRESQPVQSRYRTENREGVLKLESAQAEEGGEIVLVELGAAVPWGQAVSWTLRQQLSGLHWFARIPCQVGGAAYNNIHGEKHFFSEAICAVVALDSTSGTRQVYGQSSLEFGYDYSRFHHNPEIITSVILALPRVSAEAAAACQNLYLEWTKQKSLVQPAGANSGSVFQNLAPEAAQAIGQEAVAAAWYVDQCGLKGLTVGGMQVYDGHGNFIINTGTGTQADFIALVTRIREVVRERFGILLEPEVECINERGASYRWPKNASTGSY